MCLWIENIAKIKLYLYYWNIIISEYYAKKLWIDMVLFTFATSGLFINLRLNIFLFLEEARGNITNTRFPTAMCNYSK